MKRLREQYEKEVVPAMKEKFSYKNTMAVPKIEKVVLNTSFGKLVSGKTREEQKKIGEAIQEELSFIAGQRAVLTKAKKSIAGFKLRQGMPVGAKTTLRSSRMYDFLERLLHVVLPRSRDFRGIPASALDKQGSLTLGIREHIFFPEVSPEKSKVPFGLEVVIHTTARTSKEGLELFRLLGFPFGG